MAQHPTPPRAQTRVKPGRRTSLTQAIEFQRAIYSASTLLKQDIEETKDKLLRTRSTSALAMLVKAWDTIEDRKRILRGRPLPGSLKPERKPKGKTRPKQAIAIESPDIAAVPEPSKESLFVPDPSPDHPGGEGIGGEVA